MFQKAGLLLLCAWTGAVGGQPTLTCSFSIPADWTKALIGDAAHIKTLAGPNADLHTYQPTPQDVHRLLEADLIIGIDPTLEPWLQEICESNNLSDKVLWLGKPWLSAQGSTGHVCDNPDHAKAHHPSHAIDPHLWMDPTLVEAMVNALAERCRKLPELDLGALERRRAEYVRAIRELDGAVAAEFSALPAQRKVIVTHHGNLGRFAERYGIRVAGVILRSSSTEAADPSARALADLVQLCRAGGVRVIVCDRGQRAPAAATLAREAGLPPPIELSVDALDQPGTAAASWLGLMRDNARRLADALRAP